MGTQDKFFGGIISLVSVLIIVAWVYVMWGTQDVISDMKFTAIKILTTIIVVGFMLVVLWIGYTIATTPSIEELEAHARRRRK